MCAVEVPKTDPTENQPSLNIGGFFKVPAEHFFAKKSHKTGHSSKPAIFIGLSAGQFRDASLYTVNELLFAS
jgi:hypothetical protein